LQCVADSSGKYYIAGQSDFAETILFLRFIKKIDWTVMGSAISLTRWPSASCSTHECAVVSLPSLMMKLVGFLLLLAGWFLVLAALEMLSASTPRVLFVIAGFAIEVLGLALVFRAYIPEPGEER